MLTRSKRRYFMSFSSLAFVFALLAFLPAAVQAAGTCASSTPASGAYTVTVCITAPAAGATVSGATTVTGTVSVTGTNPGTQQLIYSLDGQYLLTDFASPYSFSLPSQKFVDGSHTLAMQALMRDGFTTSSTSIGLSFSNGVTQPPVNNNTFSISSGTAPAPGKPFVLAAVGDGASGEPAAASVVSLISSWNPNLFLYLGDVYEKGSPTEFFNWYAPGNFYGAFQPITNPVVGNHEYSGSSGAAGYFDYWNNVPHYYSYNLAGWHFIALDSTSQYNQTAPGTGQYNWLASDLAANAGKCMIAYFHHPTYNIGPEGDGLQMDSMWSLFAQYGVALVLNGHDHDYQRWTPLDGSGNPSPTGVTEFVVGTGGHGTQNFVRTDSRLVTSFTGSSAFGAVQLQLNSSGASFAFVNTAGSVLDSGVVPCNAAAADTTAPTTPTGVTASANNTIVSLAWNASTDNTGVAGYTVYRNGAPVATVASASLNYTDNSAPPNSTLSYTVDAFDLAGNHSPQSSPVSATTNGTYIFTPSADAYVNSGSPSSNYGSATALRQDASPDLHSYMRFNIQNVSGSATSAILKIYTNSSSSIGYQVRSVADNTWTESGITYSNAPAYSSTVTGQSNAITSGTWVSIDITPLVTGNGSLNLALATTSTTTLSLASRETGANAPQLIIQVGSAPAPTAPPTTQPPTPTPTSAPAATATPTTQPPTPTPTSAPAATATPTATALPPTPTPTSQPPTPTPTSQPPTPTSTPSQVTTTFAPVADSYVNSGSPSSNYGTSTSLRTDGSPVLNSYLKFSVSGLTGTIKSATLRVYSNSSSSTGYSAHGVTDTTWGETTITYSNAPAMGGIVSTSGTFSTGVWTSADVTSLVTGNGTFSIALTSTGAQINLASRESGANAPQLVIVTQ